MIVRQMRYFAAVAEHGGVGRAASALRVAQPALSRQIHALERAVGATLLVRERRGVTLTPAGTALLRGVHALQEQLERAVRRTRLAQEGKLGTLRLGLGRVALENSGVGRAIAELREQFPEIELVVDEVPSLSQAESLRAGKLNLAIGIEGASRDESLRREMMFPDSVDRALLPATHALAKSASIDPSQLRTERLMMLRATIAPFPELYDSLRQLGFSEWEEHESFDTVYGLVAAGHGWTTHVRSLPAPPGTVAVPLTGLAVPMSLVVRWNADDESPLTANAVEVFRRNGTGGGTATGRGGPPPSRRRTSGRVTSQETRQPNLEVHHLRALVVTMEEGSVSQAAQRLSLSQSGLSRQLRALEREVGIPVLRRGPSGGTTIAAEVLKAEASAALAIIEEALSRARRTGHGISGTCNIGAIPAELTGSLLSGVLRQVSSEFPSIAVEVREILTPRQLAALRAGEIDLGIASAIPGLVDDPALTSLVLIEDVVDCALVSSANPLASRDVLRPSDLASLPFYFIDRPTYPKFYDLVLATFGQLGLEPMMTGSFNGPRAVWQLAADSMGWTIGTRSFRAHPPPGTVAVPIEGLHIPTGAALLWRRDEKDPSVLALIDIFRSSRAGHLPDLPVGLA